MKNLKTSIILIAIVASASLATALSLGVLTSSQNLSNSGSIATVSSVNIGVYSDAALTQPCSTIDWSTISPSASLQRTIYIKNTGTLPAQLSIATSSWSSGASSVLTLTWDKGTGTVLAAGAQTNAVLTLTAAASTGSVTTFSFTITITGTET
jgi:hypothetical protein